MVKIWDGQGNTLIQVSVPQQALENLSPNRKCSPRLKHAKSFADHGVSGAQAERPGLDKALDQIRKKDTFVIWKLDRLGRSLSHLLSTIKDRR